jgi:hypothetical protein
VFRLLDKDDSKQLDKAEFTTFLKENLKVRQTRLPFTGTWGGEGGGLE